MKKVVVYLLLLVLVLMVFKPSAAERSDCGINRAVVTFSPFIVNDQNLTHKLFEAISKVLEKGSPLSKTLEASGTFWSVSGNLCGIQISINSSKGLDELKEMVATLLAKSLDNREELLAEREEEILSINRLYQFFVDTQSPDFAKDPVTICFFDTKGSEIILEDDAEESSLRRELNRIREFYRQGTESNSEKPVVQNISKPILATFLIWKDFTPDSFVSASIIKNRLFYDSENGKKYHVELLNIGRGLAVAIFDEGEKGNLYDQYLKMRNKIEAVTTGVGPKEWQSWSSKLLKAMESDRRDPNKNAMFSAWLKHWQAEDFSRIPNKVTYEKPDYEKEVEIFSSLEEYDFKLSNDLFPAIYACNSDSKCDLGAYVAVCFEAGADIIDSIESYVGSKFKIALPITVVRQSPRLLILSVYSQIEQVPTHLSRIRSSITELLYTGFGVTDLKNSISIGVAGISNIPAYQLQGLLKMGWTGNSARYVTRAVTPHELYALVQNESSDEEISKRRWKNLICSPRIKANILSILACRHLIINSWNP